MSNPDDDESLLSAAASISDGLPVDWDELRQRFAHSDSASIVEELQLLHSVAALSSDTSTWGPLQIFDELGQGSFATVYRAFDADLQREVALKICRMEQTRALDLQQALREARLLARVRHPNVVTVFGAQRKDDAVGLAMELIKGQTLQDVVQRQGPFSAREATLIGVDLCRAVAAVHEAGLIHGDIKAHNVMREEGGRIVLMDFGTCKDLTVLASVAGDFAGTPLYLAPEVFAGQPRTRASDIYSLGVLLYYLATATYPVSGETRTELDRRHLQPTSRRRLRDVRPDLPGAFISVVERAAAEDAAQRYQTAGAFESALVSTLDQPVEPKETSSYPKAIAAIVLLALGLTSGGVYFGIKRQQQSLDRTRSAENAAASSAKSSADPSDVPYRVEAAMYRVRDGRPKRLGRADRLAPGDELYFQVQTSVPTYIYVVNEDERGKATLLFPLPGQGNTSVSASESKRLPGVYNGEEMHWQVTTPGAREHFVIFFSPQRLPEIEQLVASLPAPRQDAPVTYAALPSELIGTLRSVGGLVTAPGSRTQSGRLSERYTTPLSDGPEDARGLWVRQITFDNPGQ